MSPTFSRLTRIFALAAALGAGAVGHDAQAQYNGGEPLGAGSPAVQGNREADAAIPRQGEAALRAMLVRRYTVDYDSNRHTLTEAMEKCKDTPQAEEIIAYWLGKEPRRALDVFTSVFKNDPRSIHILQNFYNQNPSGYWGRYQQGDPVWLQHPQYTAAFLLERAREPEQIEAFINYYDQYSQLPEAEQILQTAIETYPAKAFNVSISLASGRQYEVTQQRMAHYQRVLGMILADNPQVLQGAGAGEEKADIISYLLGYRNLKRAGWPQAQLILDAAISKNALGLLEVSLTLPEILEPTQMQAIIDQVLRNDRNGVRQDFEKGLRLSLVGQYADYAGLSGAQQIFEMAVSREPLRALDTLSNGYSAHSRIPPLAGSQAGASIERNLLSYVIRNHRQRLLDDILKLDRYAYVNLWAYKNDADLNEIMREVVARDPVLYLKNFRRMSAGESDTMTPLEKEAAQNIVARSDVNIDSDGMSDLLRLYASYLQPFDTDQSLLWQFIEKMPAATLAELLYTSKNIRMPPAIAMLDTDSFSALLLYLEKTQPQAVQQFAEVHLNSFYSRTEAIGNHPEMDKWIKKSIGSNPARALTALLGDAAKDPAAPAHRYLQYLFDRYANDVLSDIKSLEFRDSTNGGEADILLSFPQGRAIAEKIMTEDMSFSLSGQRVLLASTNPEYAPFITDLLRKLIASADGCRGRVLLSKSVLDMDKWMPRLSMAERVDALQCVMSSGGYKIEDILKDKKYEGWLRHFKDDEGGTKALAAALVTRSMEVDGLSFMVSHVKRSLTKDYIVADFRVPYERIVDYARKDLRRRLDAGKADYRMWVVVDILNTLHDSQDKTRFKLIEDVSSAELVRILGMNGPYPPYTSTFNYMLNRIVADPPRDVNSEYLLNFAVSAHNFGRIEDYLRVLDIADRMKVFEGLVRERSYHATLLEGLLAIADTQDVAVPVEKMILSYYGANKGEKAAEMGVVGALYAHSTDSISAQYADIFNALKDEYIQFAAPHLEPVMHYKNLLDDGGRHNQMMVFYNDTDGQSSFAHFIGTYRRDRSWKYKDHGSFISFAKGAVSLYANKPANEADGPAAIKAHVTDGGGVIKALIHRGHSYHVSASEKYVSEDLGFIWLGSCQSGRVSDFAKGVPNARLVYSRNVGTMQMNDPVLKDINDFLAQGQDVDWRVIKKDAERIRSNMPNADYVVPSGDLAGALGRAQMSIDRDIIPDARTQKIIGLRIAVSQDWQRYRPMPP